MKHNSAIKVLSHHLQRLNDELKKEEANMENPELHSDYEFARASAGNIELEINSITESIEVLQKV